MQSKCPHCGKDLRLTAEQRSTLRKDCLLKARDSGVRIGRPSKIDIEKLRAIYKKEKTLNRTAKVYGCSRWTVKRYTTGPEPAEEK